MKTTPSLQKNPAESAPSTQQNISKSAQIPAVKAEVTSLDHSYSFPVSKCSQSTKADDDIAYSNQSIAVKAEKIQDDNKAPHCSHFSNSLSLASQKTQSYASVHTNIQINGKPILVYKAGTAQRAIAQKKTFECPNNASETNPTEINAAPIDRNLATNPSIFPTDKEMLNEPENQGGVLNSKPEEIKLARSLSTHRYSFNCDKCFCRLDTSMELQRHVCSLKHPCTVCEERFPTKISLKNHMLTHSTKDEEETTFLHRKYPCKICDKRFPNEYMRKIHSCLADLVCTLCDRRFCSRNRLRQHKTSKHNNKGFITCGTCLKHFTSRKLLQEHKKSCSRSDRKYKMIRPRPSK